MLLLVEERLVEALLVDVVLDLVVLEHLVRGRLEVVGQGLQRRLQVVPVGDLDAVVFVQLVVGLEQVAEVLVVALERVVGVSRSDDHAHLLPHEGADALLVLLGHHGETLGVVDEGAAVHLD